MRPWRNLLGLAACAVVVVWACAEAVAADAETPRAVRLAFALAVTLPLFAAPRVPLAVACAGVLALPVNAAFDILPFPEAMVTPLQVLPAAAFVAGLYVEPGERAPLIGAALLAVTLITGATGHATAGEYVFLTALIVTPWGLGWALRTRHAEAGRMHERHAAAAREHAEQIALAVAAERRVIARDLHEIVTTSVGSIATRVAAARQVVDEQPAVAQRAMGEIRDLASDALDDMRRLLALLRDPDPPALVPSPSVAQLRGLVAAPVELEADDASLALRDGVSLAVYRLVEEVLGEPEVSVRRVRVAAQPAKVRLVIEGADEPAGDVLLGRLRERVRLYDGELEVALGATTWTLNVELPR